MNQSVPPANIYAPSGYDRVLAWGTIILLTMASLAIMRGHGHWGSIPWSIWLHIAAAMTALALTPVVLLQHRGTPRHRLIGYCWAVAIAIAAIDSFGIRTLRPGQLSLIHILSAYTLIVLVIAIAAVRSGHHALHRRMMRNTVLGGLIVAGALTFPFGRLLGTWLFGGG